MSAVSGAIWTASQSCVDAPVHVEDGDVVFLPVAAPLDDALGLLGGKAAALDAMLRAELPVPSTAVVTTDAFGRVRSSPAVDEVVESLRAPDARWSAAEIDSLLLRVGMPDDVRRRVLEARRLVAPDGPVAVRSSATAEDLAGASFAGQFRSVVGADTDDEVIEAVLLVWASLWHPAPRAYRRLHGLGDVDAAMAVVIQAMVPATSAGVVFTVDPGGRPDHVRLEHVEGLGEALVSGEVTPQAEVVDRRLDQRLPSGLDAAVRLALRAEELFGVPQDVEWAIADGRTWLLQSRPITTEAAGSASADAVGDGADSPISAERRYTTAGIGEMLPGVLPTLRWATAGFMVEEAFRHVLAELGALPSELSGADGFVVRVRGRAALDLDHLSSVATALPGGSADELEEQYFGVAAPEAAPEPARVLDRIRHDLRVITSTRTARREQAVVRAAVDALRIDDVARRADGDLLARRRRFVDLGVRATIAEFSVATSAVAAFRRLERALARELGTREGTRWSHRVTAGLRPPAALRSAARTRATIAAVEPTALEIARWDQAVDALRGAGHDTVVAEVVAAGRRAGCRRIVGGSTWSEDPQRFWGLVRAADVRSGGAGEPLDELNDVLDAVPGRIRRRALTGQVVDVRRVLIRRLVRDARDLLQRREDAKSDLLLLGGAIRAIDLELGRRLAERGRLVHAIDVEHLRPLELRSLITGADEPSVGEILRRRRWIERCRSDDELPVAFVGPPPRTHRDAPDGDRFVGWGASPGRHTGPVRLLAEPDEMQVEPGDVVVARRTDASWSPVFLRAAAIVVEEGGPLSHAAIVARELGLPAVINVPGVVARLRTEPGPITIDGDEGIVVVGPPQSATATRTEAPC